MPAVTPAERPNPERYGSSNRQPPPRLVAWPARPPTPPQPAPSFPISVSSVFSVLLARRFFSAREDFLCRHTCLVAALPRCGLFFLCPPCRVRCGAGFLACGRLSSRPWPPLPTAPPPPNRPPWSMPPGLPCRRSRRQSHTIPSCAGVPTPCGPQDCALQLKPPPPCAPGSLCGARLSSRPGRPSPTALCSFPVLCPAGELHCPASVSSRTHAYISQPH